MHSQPAIRLDDARTRKLTRLTPARRTATPTHPPGVSRPYPSVEAMRGVCKPTSPCLQLALAVLDDALTIILAGRHGRNQRQWLEAVEWTLTDDPTWVFSFHNVCDLLDIDGSRLRAALQHWTQVRRAAAPRGSLLDPDGQAA